MKLENILDHEELRIIQWAKENIPECAFTDDDIILQKILHHENYAELPEKEKEIFLSKIQEFKQTHTVTTFLEHNTLMSDILFDVLNEVNKELDNELNNG